MWLALEALGIGPMERLKASVKNKFFTLRFELRSKSRDFGDVEEFL